MTATDPPTDLSEIDPLKRRITYLSQQVQQLQQDKVDLEILLETTTEHSIIVETELAKAQADLRRALEQERELNRRIEELATLEERNRIARDIHDTLGHLLVGLNVQMETALALWKEHPEKAYTFLTKAKKIGSDALQATRQSVADLRFDPLEGRSLEEGINLLVQDFYDTTGIPVDCQIQFVQSPSKRISTVLYRVVQEGLTNICKHANATVVTLGIESNKIALRLILQDNGKGFQMDANRSGFGLQGMQERITALGGQVEIISQPGAGCCISVFLPLESHSLMD